MMVAYIIWLRQLKRYIRTRSRIVGALGQPLLFLIALGYGFGPIYQRAGQGNYIEFIVPGIVSMSILFTSIFSGTEIIWDKQFGFLKETLVAPVSRFTIMIGRTLGGATVAFIQGLIVIILTSFVGFHVLDWWSVPLALLFMFMIALVFTSLGAVIGVMLDDMQGFQLIINFLVMPLFFLSGALFPISTAPGPLKVIASLDPLSYGVDGLRHALLQQGQFHVATDFTVLAVLAVLLLGLGSYMFTRVQV